MAPRETEINAYAKFWGDKQRALWYVMVFLEWSITLAESTQNAKIKFPGAFLFIVLDGRVGKSPDIVNPLFNLPGVIHF